MEIYNYKVVAELRSDLSETDKHFISEKMNELMEKMGIVNIGENTFCKKPPIVEYNDFGPVGFFFVELRYFKNYFSKLEYYNMWRGEIDIAV